MRRRARRLWRPAAWAGACLLGLALAPPAQAQTGERHRGNHNSTAPGTTPAAGGTSTSAGGTQTTPGGTAGTTGGTSTGGTTSSSGSSGFGGGFDALFAFFNSFASLVQLTPAQEVGLMTEALNTVETLVTALQIQDGGEVLFLFLFVYEVYRFEMVFSILTGGTTGG